MRRILLWVLCPFLLSACLAAQPRVPAAFPPTAPQPGPIRGTLLPVTASRVPSGILLPTSTARMPVEQTLQAAQSQAAPTVSARLTGTAAVISTLAASLTRTCAIDEPVCILDGHFLMQRPIAKPHNTSVDQTYRYGSTQEGKREPHHGVEFPNAQGTPVLASADGIVVFAGDDKKVSLAWVPAYYGNVVVIKHYFAGISGPVFSLYAHLYKIQVEVGEKVSVGEQIGQVGATGTAIGSHLHFEVRVAENNYRSNRNSELWLEPLSGTGVLAGRLQDAQGQLMKGMINVQRIENGVLNPLPVTALETYDTRESQPVQLDDTWQENFAAGELPAGKYRLSLHYNGTILDQVVQIEPGKLTFVRFVLK